MARKNSDKKPDSAPERIRLYLSVKAPLATKLRVAAAALGLSETEMMERLIADNLSSVHARGLPEKYAGGVADDGTEQGRGVISTPPTVKIATNPINRISEIHTRATAPVDDGIDEIMNG